MGDVDELEDAPFARLDRMVGRLRASGARVVLVDLPIPHWHAEGSLLAKDYRRRIDPQLDRLAALPGVRVLRLADDDSDDDFSDEVHPKPRVTSRWAARLAKGLQPEPASLQKL